MMEVSLSPGLTVSHLLLCKKISSKTVVSRLVATAMSLCWSLAEDGEEVPPFAALCLIEFTGVGVQEVHSK